MLAEQSLVQIFLHPRSCVLYVYDQVESIFNGNALLFDKTPQKQSSGSLTKEGKGFQSNYIIIYHYFWRYSSTPENCPKKGHKRRRTAYPFLLRIVHSVEMFLHAEEIKIHYTIHISKTHPPFVAGRLV